MYVRRLFLYIKRYDHVEKYTNMTYSLYKKRFTFYNMTNIIAFDSKVKWKEVRLLDALVKNLIFESWIIPSLQSRCLVAFRSMNRLLLLHGSSWRSFFFVSDPVRGLKVENPSRKQVVLELAVSKLYGFRCCSWIWSCFPLTFSKYVTWTKQRLDLCRIAMFQDYFPCLLWEQHLPALSTSTT